MTKSYPSEELLILMKVIFNVNSNGVHPRFWIRAQMPRIRQDFDNVLEILDYWLLEMGQSPLLQGASLRHRVILTYLWSGPLCRPISSGPILSKWSILDIHPLDFRHRFHICQPGLPKPETSADQQPRCRQHLQIVTKRLPKSNVLLSHGHI